MIRIYLDNCCLNRLFDDQSQARIRLESEAVALVLLHVQQKAWVWVGGDVLDWEVVRTPDPERRAKLSLLLGSIHDRIPVTGAIRQRAKGLVRLGFKGRDALHVASAETGGVDALLTTDDDLQRKAPKARRSLRVKVLNPTEWVRGVIE